MLNNLTKHKGGRPEGSKAIIPILSSDKELKEETLKKIDIELIRKILKKIDLSLNLIKKENAPRLSNIGQTIYQLLEQYHKLRAKMDGTSLDYQSLKIELEGLNNVLIAVQQIKKPEFVHKEVPQSGEDTPENTEECDTPSPPVETKEPESVKVLETNKIEEK